jgi:hypothetical protein
VRGPKLSTELVSVADSAVERERARAFFVVAGIFGSAALASSLMLHTAQGSTLSAVLLALTAIGGVVARRFRRI